MRLAVSDYIAHAAVQSHQADHEKALALIRLIVGRRSICKWRQPLEIAAVRCAGNLGHPRHAGGGIHAGGRMSLHACCVLRLACICCCRCVKAPGLHFALKFFTPIR
jgi:hypothetical protein